MTFAIAILNHNGSILLKRFIPKVIENCQGAKLYLIDNKSSDSSVDYISKNYPEIKIIRLNDNYGYAKGYNDGVKEIHEDVVIFLNNDAVFIEKDSFAEICKTFELNHNISIAQPRIIDYNNHKLYEYAGASGGYLDFLGYPFCRGRIINKLESSELYKTTREIFWASGSCFVVRRKAFNKINGFDESFFCHMEEIDLCWRLKNLDPHCKIVTIGKSKVYHIGGGTMQYDNPKKNYLNFRNSITMMIKNLPATYLIPVMILRTISDLLIIILSIITLKINLSFSILYAYYYNIVNIRVNLLKRTKTNKINNYYYCKSILINYYIFGIKTFSSLK